MVYCQLKSACPVMASNKGKRLLIELTDYLGRWSDYSVNWLRYSLWRIADERRCFSHM